MDIEILTHHLMHAKNLLKVEQRGHSTYNLLIFIQKVLVKKINKKKPKFGAKETLRSISKSLLNVSNCTDLRKELQVTEKLLEERQRVLDAIPKCKSHGSCVPHAIQWIEKMKSREDEKQPKPE